MVIIVIMNKSLNLLLRFFFCFKQKTSYDMRISDWSSDVCSSDLDLLLHFVWSGLPNYDSPHHMKRELPAQAAFLSACVRSGTRRVVVAGTCFEYGQIGRAHV